MTDRDQERPKEPEKEQTRGYQEVHEHSAPAERKRFTIPLIGSIAAGAVLLALLLFVLPTIIALISFFFPGRVPPDDRYYYINQVLEGVDYKSAGKIIEEGYDNHQPNPLNPAYFRATFEDSEAFNILRPRILKEIGYGCSDSETEVSCLLGRPGVALILQDDGTVLLSLNDSGTGR